ncbi:MAG: nucleotidyltransferase substrate binding protein [Chitinophagaceae bacterium]|nr:nucleotidyltransferase substrate binding protein [Chitinophagaceae bacterium]MDP1763273.1 nucleotidyltransferase substrate binding protein [Sediminibacterium sp.]MDP3668059.1 nucleotidyltransferase substrate binding protein [Sediminibacterium sp.]
MKNADIRWKQRFQNFEMAVSSLKEAVTKNNLSDLERAGVIKIYEFTFELAWKTVKDYLEEKDVEVKFPRDTIKEGFLYEIIADGEIWLDMLQKRNLMSHTYSKENAELAYHLIVNDYFKELYDVYTRLKNEI